MKQFLVALIALSMFSHAWTCGMLSPVTAPKATDDSGLFTTPDIIVQNEYDNSISSAEELIYFFTDGTEQECNLECDIELGFNMLKLTEERGSITINGAGHTLKGSAECIIRMDNDTTLTLNDLSIISGAICIAVRGDGRINANTLTIESETNAFDVNQTLTIGENSNMMVTSNKGYGVIASGFTLEQNSDVIIHALSSNSAIRVASEGILLSNKSILTATGYGYNVLYCGSALSMLDGSCLNVTNFSDYHACEIDSLSIDGIPEIHAHGGSSGVGIFIAILTENLHVVGECTPELRKEKGRGSISFYESAAVVPTPTPLESSATDPSNTP